MPGRPPQVLFLIIGGVIIGPHALGFADSVDIELLAGLGLGFLFLLAGHELDPKLLRERAGTQALVAWTISAVLALLVVGGASTDGHLADVELIDVSANAVKKSSAAILREVVKIVAPSASTAAG